jgi:hypothetical protein
MMDPSSCTTETGEIISAHFSLILISQMPGLVLDLDHNGQKLIQVVYQTLIPLMSFKDMPRTLNSW